MTDTPTRRPRGFAAMTAEQRTTIASQGGRAAHAGGKAHQFTSEEAKAAAARRADRKPKTPA
jgi:uncharacterized protein